MKTSLAIVLAVAALISGATVSLNPGTASAGACGGATTGCGEGAAGAGGASATGRQGPVITTCSIRRANAC